MPLGCLTFGHRPAFRAEGRTMRWECERGYRKTSDDCLAIEVPE